MSTVETAVVQHALDVAKLYKDNCALIRGIPDKPARLTIDEQHPKVVEGPQGPPGKDAQIDVNAIVAQVRRELPQVDASQPVVTSWMKPALLTAASILGGAGTGALGMYLWPSGEKPQPVEQGTDVLLEYMQQQGYHLPKDKRPIHE